MTLRERLIALADNYPSRMTNQQYHELAVESARLALDEAAKVAVERAARVGHRALPTTTGEACAISIRALRSQLDEPK